MRYSRHPAKGGAIGTFGGIGTGFENSSRRGERELAKSHVVRTVCCSESIRAHGAEESIDNTRRGDAVYGTICATWAAIPGAFLTSNMIFSSGGTNEKYCRKLLLSTRSWVASCLTLLTSARLIGLARHTNAHANSTQRRTVKT